MPRKKHKARPRAGTPTTPQRNQPEPCTKTGHYLTQALAEAALETIQSSPTRAEQYPQRIFWCEEHTCFHLTSQVLGRYTDSPRR